MFTRKRLNIALASIGTAPAPQLFDQLLEMYTEPTRHYHTDQHVSECLTALDTHVAIAERPGEVEVAIWFHDAIYDSRRPDNEDRSAALAVRTLDTLSVASDSIERIESMIIATRSHIAAGSDMELLLDIDLGILGQQPTVFARYDESIRKEYSWVPEDRYRSGRANVLRGFLDRPRIYATNAFRDRYEGQARRNLELRLKELEG